MDRIRFFIALVLVAAGCALVIVSLEPAQAGTVVWVGDRSHAASLIFLPRADTSTEVKSS